MIKIDTTSNIDSSTRAEAYILNQLRNIDGIIKVLDFGVSKDNRYLKNFKVFISLGSF